MRRFLLLIPACLFLVAIMRVEGAGQAPQGNTAQTTAYGEKDLPPGTLTGLTEEQKKNVLQAIREKNCNCGCTNGPIIACRIKDPKCSVSTRLLSQAIDLSKQGKTSEQIMKGLVAVAKPATPPQPPAVSMVAYRASDPYEGPRYAKVTIIEFSDFQCPFCQRASSTLKKIRETYPKEVKIIYKHKPLPFHPNAIPAAEAAEAAREQGQFWKMHDLIFANQRALAPAKLEEWARQIGLNMVQYAESIQKHKNQKRIQEDSQLGESLGASGTPTFFVNGRLFIGAQPFESFKSLIDQEIVRADVLIKKGNHPDETFYKKIVEENLKTVISSSSSSQKASSR